MLRLNADVQVVRTPVSVKLHKQIDSTAGFIIQVAKRRIVLDIF